MIAHRRRSARRDARCRAMSWCTVLVEYSYAYAMTPPHRVPTRDISRSRLPRLASPRRLARRLQNVTLLEFRFGFVTATAVLRSTVPSAKTSCPCMAATAAARASDISAAAYPGPSEKISCPRISAAFAPESAVPGRRGVALSEKTSNP